MPNIMEIVDLLQGRVLHSTATTGFNIAIASNFHHALEGFGQQWEGFHDRWETQLRTLQAKHEGSGAVYKDFAKRLRESEELGDAIARCWPGMQKSSS